LKDLVIIQPPKSPFRGLLRLQILQYMLNTPLPIEIGINSGTELSCYKNYFYFYCFKKGRTAKIRRFSDFAVL